MLDPKAAQRFFRAYAQTDDEAHAIFDGIRPQNAFVVPTRSGDLIYLTDQDAARAMLSDENLSCDPRKAPAASLCRVFAPPEFLDGTTPGGMLWFDGAEHARNPETGNGASGEPLQPLQGIAGRAHIGE